MHQEVASTLPVSKFVRTLHENIKMFPYIRFVNNRVIPHFNEFYFMGVIEDNLNFLL